ncbi:MAG TPA: DinB family protein [Chitinophaga sp.]|uniref:DinB family protein n=1 Tax=Chitinophaga sp. TaxID=1869181 RepID=UPI002B9E93FB|nr:DinB family protein [Chitinophaga sp.]HVI45574.1 DinB family protein [Chitinophaga sp.]
MISSKYFLIPRASGQDAAMLNQLITQMEFVRNKHLNYISRFSTAVLDVRLGEGGNSIGTLLKHLAAMEYKCQLATFEGRGLNESEQERWRGALNGELILNLIKGHDIDYYIQLLTEVRKETLQQMMQKNDEWLLGSTAYHYDTPTNNYFCWFHIMEDEIGHIGQIKMLMSLFKNKV